MNITPCHHKEKKNIHKPITGVFRKPSRSERSGLEAFRCITACEIVLEIPSGDNERLEPGHGSAFSVPR